MNRVGTYSRKTNETQIDITFNIDGKGKANIDTGIGFFDHMLNNFARHGLFDLDVSTYSVHIPLPSLYFIFHHFHRILHE